MTITMTVDSDAIRVIFGGMDKAVHTYVCRRGTNENEFGSGIGKYRPRIIQVGLYLLDWSCFSQMAELEEDAKGPMDRCRSGGWGPWKMECAALSQ